MCTSAHKKASKSTAHRIDGKYLYIFSRNYILSEMCGGGFARTRIFAPQRLSFHFDFRFASFVSCSILFSATFDSTRSMIYSSNFPATADLPYNNNRHKTFTAHKRKRALADRGKAQAFMSRVVI